MYLFIGHEKMNFGFNRFDTKPTSVDPLAEKSEGIKLKKPRAKASSSSLLDKRTWAIEAAEEKRSKKIREKGPIWSQKTPTFKSPSPIAVKGELVVIPSSSAPTTFAKELRDIGSPSFIQAQFSKRSKIRFC
jgi:hypothetical protein